MRFLDYYQLLTEDFLAGHLLVLCSVVLSALVADRLRALARAAGPGAALRESLERSLAAGELHEALVLAAATPGAFARVAVRVLRDGLREPAHMEAAAEEALAVELPPLERRFAAFGFLASLTTLIGLLGTMTALLWPGYGCSTRADVASWRAAIALTVSESMVCIAAALFVTALALAARGVVRALIDRRTTLIRAETRALVNTLIASRAHLRILEHRPILEPRGYRRVDARL